MGEDHAQIYAYTRLQSYTIGNEIPAVVSVLDSGTKRTFKEDHFFFADSNLFEFFGIRLLKGTPERVLSQAGSIVVSEAMAKKYFGTEEAVGKVVSLNDTSLYTVTGVFQELPHSSHLNFDLVAFQPDILNRTGWNITHGYYKIMQHTDLAALSKEMDRYIHENYSKRWNWDNVKEETILQPITAVAFEDLSWNGFTVKSRSHLAFLGVVGIVILIMAWINYSSLTLSRTEERLKEIATRKTSGASSKDLFKQFIADSVLVNAMAISLAITIVQLAKPLCELLLHFYILPWSVLSPNLLLKYVLDDGGGSGDHRSLPGDSCSAVQPEVFVL